MKRVVIEEPQQLLNDLQVVLNVLKDIGFGQSSYGFFYGGDPNNFTPDEDATDEERARWKHDCAAFKNGEQGPTPSSCGLNEEAFTSTRKGGKTVTVDPGQALVTKSFYGTGINLKPSEANIIADLEDLCQQLEFSAKSGK